MVKCDSEVLLKCEEINAAKILASNLTKADGSQFCMQYTNFNSDKCKVKGCLWDHNYTFHLHMFAQINACCLQQGEQLHKQS